MQEDGKESKLTETRNKHCASQGLVHEHGGHAHVHSDTGRGPAARRQKNHRGSSRDPRRQRDAAPTPRLCGRGQQGQPGQLLEAGVCLDKSYQSRRVT